MKSIILILQPLLFLSLITKENNNPKFVFQTETRCEITAYVADPDPNGLNVRSGAGTNFKVIKTIPKDNDGTIVEIVSSSGSWMKISSARNAEGETVFSGSGWVYAPNLATSVPENNIKHKAYLSADKKSKVVSAITENTEYRLKSCKGSWVEVSIGKGSELISGWLPPESQCGNPMTNCP